MAGSCQKILSHLLTNIQKISIKRYKILSLFSVLPAHSLMKKQIALTSRIIMLILCGSKTNKQKCNNFSQREKRHFLPSLFVYLCDELEYQSFINNKVESVGFHDPNRHWMAASTQPLSWAPTPHPCPCPFLPTLNSSYSPPQHKWQNTVTLSTLCDSSGSQRPMTGLCVPSNTRVIVKDCHDCQ